MSVRDKIPGEDSLIVEASRGLSCLQTSLVEERISRYGALPLYNLYSQSLALVIVPDTRLSIALASSGLTNV